MTLSWTFVIKLIRKSIRCIILDKIKAILWNILSGLIKNSCTIFLYKKAVTDHFFVSLFEVKSQNEPIAIKNIPQDFINAASSLISHKMQEKWDGKVTAKVYFSKQMFLFHLFLPFILRYVKNVLNFQSIITIIFHIYFHFFYFWMLQFTDKFSSWNHQACWKKKNMI